MNNIVSIRLEKVASNTVLAGAAAGAAVQAKILAAIAARPPSICCLDFTNIECATASFVREAVFGTRDAIRRLDLSTQIIVANASSTVIEEIILVARTLNSCVVHAIGSDPDKLSRPSVLGSLDAAQRDTLNLIVELGEATATELTSTDPEVRPTAWNNRLTSLMGRGILIESRRNRHKVYRPILKGLTYGG